MSLGLVEYFVIGVLTILTIMVLFQLYDKRVGIRKLRAIREEIQEFKEIQNANLRLAESIGRGEYTATFVVSSQNIIGQALLQMRENLSKVSQEDEHRNWVARGLAKFSNILHSDQNIFEMTDVLMSEVVRYIGANQGRLFFVNDDDPDKVFFELKACFAWERNKYVDMQIGVDEGLVGRCYKEKMTIYLTEIPDNYVYITSGLGEANPKALLITPIKIDNKVFGIIELASFKEFQPHHIEFIEKLGSNMAASISNIKITEQTRNLLEDMQRAKEESEMAQASVKAQLDFMNNIISISKTNLEGTITYVNEKMCTNTGFTERELIGQNHRILKHEGNKPETYKKIWETITQGKVYRGEMMNKTKEGETRHLDCIIAPLLDKNGEAIEYIAIRFPIDEKKEKEAQMEEMFKSLQEEKQRTEAILEGAVDAIVVLGEATRIKYVNVAAQELFGDSRQHLVGNRIFDYLPVKSESLQNLNTLYSIESNQKIGVRTELSFTNTIGEQKDVLITASEFFIGAENHCALFIQNITVDLF